MKPDHFKCSEDWESHESYVATEVLLLYQMSLHLRVLAALHSHSPQATLLSEQDPEQSGASWSAVRYKIWRASSWSSVWSVPWPTMQEKPHEPCPRKMSFQQQVGGSKTDQNRQPHIARPLGHFSKVLKFNRGWGREGKGRVNSPQERTAHCTSNPLRLFYCSNRSTSP